MQVISEKSKKKMVSIIALFVALICGVIAPALSHKVYADTELQFSVEVPPILEITLLDSAGATLGSSTSMEVRPSLNSAAFNEKDVTVNVGTNNEWGYNLIMSVPNTNLTSIEGGVINNLPGLDEDPNSPPTGPIGYTCSTDNANDCNFTINSWGYKLKQATTTRPASNYVPVEQEISLTKTNTLTNSDKTYLSFGSRVDSTLAPGTYTTTIVFVATANPDTTPVMQEIDYATLTTLAPNDGNTVTLKDKRDNNKYTITKIADGLYWMTDNLRITGTITAELSNFSGADFNISAGSLVVDWENTYTEPRATASDNKNYGSYYNYCAASAGTVCNEDTQKDAIADICPAGWRLPTYNEVAIIANRNTTNRNPILAGYYDSGDLIDAEFYGYWWSATSSSQYTNNQYYLYNNNNNTWDVMSMNKNVGYSVRCVYDTPTYMQDVTASDLATFMPNNGDTKVLYDKRDENRYTITKITDDIYWMTDNLNARMDTISAELSNFSGEDFHITVAKSLEELDKCRSTDEGCSLYDENNPEYKPEYGVYYNFCAASAGTQDCDNVNRSNATEDICPAKWRLPTSAEMTTIAGADTIDKNPVLAGNYNSWGEAWLVGYEGEWYSASGSTYRYLLTYYGYGATWSAGSRSAGSYLRSLRCMFAM